MSRLALTSCQFFVVWIGWLVAGSTAAMASSPLPPYTATTSCTSGSLGVVDGSAPCSQANGDGSDNDTFTVSPFAGVSANSSVAGNPEDGFGSFGTLDYSFELVGGNPGDQVPLLIFTDLFTSIGGDAYAFSEIVVSTGSTGLGSVVACQSYGGTCPPSASANFSGSFGLIVSSGALEDLHLEVEATSNPVLGAATSSATADPLIEINPGFSNAGNYSIELSPGVGNGVAPIPEPGTLILVCIAPLLFLARRCFSR
jgi:hypothetical protein